MPHHLENWDDKTQASDDASWSLRCEMSGLGNPLGYGDLKPESFNPLAQSLYLNSWIVVALEVIGT